MVNHDVVRLHIAVHDSLRVAVIKRLQNLEHVEADIEVVETLVEFAEISVTCIDKLSDNGWRLRQWVAHNIDQLNNVNAVLQGLQDLNLAADLVLLNYRA